MIMHGEILTDRSVGRGSMYLGTVELAAVVARGAALAAGQHCLAGAKPRWAPAAGVELGVAPRPKNLGSG